MVRRIARVSLVLFASALILGLRAAQADVQLFHGSWSVKAFGNECSVMGAMTGPHCTTGMGGGEWQFYSAIAIPQGIQCNPYHPRCPFNSTPTNGKGVFHPLGGSSPTSVLYCAPWSNWQGKGTTVRPAKGGTVFSGMGGGIPIPPLYRNYGFFSASTPSAQPYSYSCNARSTDGFGGKGAVQLGNPITGSGFATSTGGVLIVHPAPAIGTPGIRGTDLIAEHPYTYGYGYKYTYATLRNSLGVFGTSSGPGNFNLAYGVASINVKQGPAKFGGTMRMLGALTYKSCEVYIGSCSRGSNNWRYDAIGTSAYTSGGVVTVGYLATYMAYYYQTSLMQQTTVTAAGYRFPWTTGSVTVTATGRGPHQTVHYAQGFDNRTTAPSGLGTVQLVSPVLTRWLRPAFSYETAGIGILRIKFISPPPVTAVFQAESVSTDMGTSFNVLANVSNQSGLSAGYQSGDTDFDTYIASTPTHDSVSGGWASSGTTSGNVDFDLGGTFIIRSIAFWNVGGDASENITGMTLLADDDAGFSNPVTLGSFTPDTNTGSIFSVVAEVFAFAPISASHVRMQITSNNGNANTAFGEAAFEILHDWDNDGILDIYETDTGNFVSSTDTGTDRFDADSDNDGLDDGEEVALGTDPNDEDSDDDGVCDGGMQVGVCTASGPDNCPFISNALQTNSDALTAGDDCQCGDVTGDGSVTQADVDEVRGALMGGTAVTNPDRCNVIGASDGGNSDCDIADIFVLQRFVGGSPVTVANACDAYTGEP